jgi:hypothetical protein
MSAWDPLPDESAKAFGRFMAYLALGRDRSLAKLNRRLGRKPSYVTQLKKWSAKHNWVARARDYDNAELADMVEDRHMVREYLKQDMYNEGRAAVRTVISTVKGECPIPPCSCDAEHPDDCVCDPVTIPVLDRHGREIGSKPLVAPSTRLQGAIAMLDRIGLNVPKRMELSGPDGEALEIELREAMDNLTDDQLAAVAAGLAVGTDDGEAEP